MLKYDEINESQFRIDPAIVKKLKYLALDHDKTLTELFLEAIKDLFKKYGKGTEK